MKAGFFDKIRKMPFWLWLVVGVAAGLFAGSYLTVKRLHLLPVDLPDAVREQVVARNEAEENLIRIKEEAVRGQVWMATEIRRLKGQLDEARLELAVNRQAGEKVEKAEKPDMGETVEKIEKEDVPRDLTRFGGTPGSDDVDNWESRYKYAVYKYNVLVGNYDRLQKKYIFLTGADGGSKGIVTGAQFYRQLQDSTKTEINSISQTIRKGVRTGEKKELELQRDGLEERERWLRSSARKAGIEQ